MKTGLFLFCLSALLSPAGLSAQAPVDAAGFAVVELFTSEGCSSCPPSDEVLSRLVKEADGARLPVYALEWHVDYWDYLGWKDPFDLHQATERQYAYARALPSSVYTPQAVINGVFVPRYAGDFAEVSSITRSLARGSPRAELSLRVHRQGSGGESAWQVHAEITGAPAGSILLLALVESGLSARPTAGENQGRTLSHSNVVRTAVAGPATSGDTLVMAARGVDPAQCRIIGLLQDRTSMRIYAAAQAFLAAAGAAAGAGARISGRVVNTGGQALAGVPVQACSGAACIPAITDENGFFVIPAAAPGRWTIIAGPSGSSAREVNVGRGDAALEQPIVLGE